MPSTASGTAAASGSGLDSPDPHLEQIEQAGGAAALEAHFDDLVALLTQRQRAVRIDVAAGEPEATYAELLHHLGS